MFELIGTMIFLVCGVDVLRKWLFADNTKDWNKYLFHLFLLVIVFLFGHMVSILWTENMKERENENKEKVGKNCVEINKLVATILIAKAWK